MEVVPAVVRPVKGYSTADGKQIPLENALLIIAQGTAEHSPYNPGTPNKPVIPAATCCGASPATQEARVDRQDADRRGQGRQARQRGEPQLRSYERWRRPRSAICATSRALDPDAAKNQNYQAGPRRADQAGRDAEALRPGARRCRLRDRAQLRRVRGRQRGHGPARNRREADHEVHAPDQGRPAGEDRLAARQADRLRRPGLLDRGPRGRGPRRSSMPGSRAPRRPRRSRRSCASWRPIATRRWRRSRRWSRRSGRSSSCSSISTSSPPRCQHHPRHDRSRDPAGDDPRAGVQPEGLVTRAEAPAQLRLQGGPPLGRSERRRRRRGRCRARAAARDPRSCRSSAPTTTSATVAAGQAGRRPEIGGSSGVQNGMDRASSRSARRRVERDHGVPEATGTASSRRRSPTRPRTRCRRGASPGASRRTPACGVGHEVHDELRERAVERRRRRRAAPRRGRHDADAGCRSRHASAKGAEGSMRRHLTGPEHGHQLARQHTQPAADVEGPLSGPHARGRDQRPGELRPVAADIAVVGLRRTSRNVAAARGSLMTRACRVRAPRSSSPEAARAPRRRSGAPPRSRPRRAPRLARGVAPPAPADRLPGDVLGQVGSGPRADCSAIPCSRTQSAGSSESVMCVLLGLGR